MEEKYTVGPACGGVWRDIGVGAIHELLLSENGFDLDNLPIEICEE
jgi:hypothetical protein